MIFFVQLDSTLLQSARSIVPGNAHSKYEQFVKNNMRSGQVSKPNGPFEIVERKLPEPGDWRVRVKVQACWRYKPS
jgi:hypothetical protein